MSAPQSAQDVIAKSLMRSWKNMHTNESGGYQRMLAQATLDALVAAGYAVVKLPEPDVGANTGRTGLIAGWDVDADCLDVWDHEPGLVHVAMEDDFCQPEHARRLAAALLAAAAYAEVGEDRG